MGKSAHCEPSDNRVSLRPSFRQTSALPMPRSSARLLAIALGLTLRAERTRSCTVLLRRRRAQFRFARTGLAHGRVLRLRGSLCGTLRRGRLTCLRRSSGSYAFLAEFAGACCGQSGEAPTHTRKRFIDTISAGQAATENQSRRMGLYATCIACAGQFPYAQRSSRRCM